MWLKPSNIAAGRQNPYEKGTCIFENKQTGIRVGINMAKDLAIKGGAFTKCTNPSFAVKNGIGIEVYSPIKVKGFANETHLVVDVELTKVFAYIDLIGAMSFSQVKEEKPTPDSTPKNPDEGPSAEAVPEEESSNNSSVNGAGGTSTYAGKQTGENAGV